MSSTSTGWRRTGIAFAREMFADEVYRRGASGETLFKEEQAREAMGEESGARMRAFIKGLWCKRFEVEPSRRREVALDHAARTAFQILGALLPLAPSRPSLN
jgi:hypothetical protein